MTNPLQVPVADGERGLVLDAALDLERRAQRVHETANEFDRLSQLVAEGWNGHAADAFEIRVVAARRALDGVSDIHSQSARLLMVRVTAFDGPFDEIDLGDFDLSVSHMWWEERHG